MSILSHSYFGRAAIGIMASLGIGLAIILICNTVWAIAGGFPISTLWDDASLTQILIAASPFLILSVCGISARRPWIVGLCMTLAFWGYYLWDITHYEGGGANIGLGLLMLLSPVVITAACLLVHVTLAGGRRSGDVAAGG